MASVLPSLDWNSVVATVLAAWFVLVALRQVASMQQFLTAFRLIAGRTVPQWHLFTGDLRELNVRLYTRDLLDGGAVTDWRELAPVGRGGTARLSFRERRVEYACSQLARGVVCSTRPRPGSERDAELTPSLMAQYEYQFLLDYARAQPAPPSAQGRQLLLATNASETRSVAGLEGMARRAAPFPFTGLVVRVVTPFHVLRPGERLIRPVPGDAPSRTHLRRVA